MVTSVKGFKDIFGFETHLWQKMEEIIKKTFHIWGFEEVRLPILEKTELFQRSIGDSTDIVEKEMYSFVDKGNESVTLRPEGTASVIRLFNEHKLYGTDRLFKFYYMGPMFRYERPQKGRLRQFNQAGVELLGDQSPYAELEVITLSMHILDSLGIKERTLKLNSLGCKKCRNIYRDKLISFLSNVSNLCEDCLRRKSTNPLRVLDCKKAECQDTIKNAPKTVNFICKSCAEHFSEIKRLLDNLHIAYIIDPFIVRGLDYYNRTVFEIHSEGLGSQSAILAGGRYDSLSSDLGGFDIPAVGWAMGMERLASILPHDFIDIPKEDVFFVLLDRDAEKKALPVIYELRKNGIKASFDLFHGSFKSQMRKADKLNSRFVVIIGENELRENFFILKNMNDGTQIQLPLENITELLRKEL